MLKNDKEFQEISETWIKLKKIGIDHFFKFGGFGSDHINRADLVNIAIQRAEKKYGIGKNTQIFHFGDAPQDMIAGRLPVIPGTGFRTKRCCFS